MVQKALKFRNRRNQHNYRYKLLCCDIKTGEILKHRSVVKKNGVYLYYQNQKQQCINQTIIDKQIPKFFDKYINEIMRTELKSKISTLKRKDHGIKELDYYFETGLISMDYYINTKSSINEVIENKERELQSVANGFKKWNMMSSGQKRRFLLMQVEKILINLDTKRVKKVIYKATVKIQ